MKLPEKAQSTIEYATIATLVILGIVIMGPYVIRAINAHFRSLDDGIKDSFSEELVQAPRQGFDIATCNCPGLHSTPTCGGSLCKPNERLYTQECQPPGCEINLKTKDMLMEECRPDATCCSAWATATVCPGGPEGGKCCGVNAAGVTGFGQSCADGHDLEFRTCFTTPPTIEYRCRAESVPACVFTCSADHGTTANWCCDTTADPNCYQKNLAHNTATTFVAFGTPENPKQNCTTAPCQSYCNTDLIATAGGCVEPIRLLPAECSWLPQKKIDGDNYNYNKETCLDPSYCPSTDGCIMTNFDGYENNAPEVTYSGIKCATLSNPDVQLKNCQWSQERAFDDYAPDSGPLDSNVSCQSEFGQNYVQVGMACIFGCRLSKIYCCELRPKASAPAGTFVSIHGCYWSGRRKNDYDQSMPDCRELFGAQCGEINDYVQINTAFIGSNGRARWNQIECCEMDVIHPGNQSGN